MAHSKNRTKAIQRFSNVISIFSISDTSVQSKPIAINHNHHISPTVFERNYRFLNLYGGKTTNVG